AAVATDPGRALTLCACAEALLESIGAAPDHDVKRTLDEVKAAAAARLGPDAEAAATATAQGLAFRGMVELALGRPPLHDAHAPPLWWLRRPRFAPRVSSRRPEGVDAPPRGRSPPP